MRQLARRHDGRGWGRCQTGSKKVTLLMSGLVLLSLLYNVRENNYLGGYSQQLLDPSILVNEPIKAFEWMDTRGIALSHIVGDPNTCKDVIYMGDSRDPWGPEAENNYVTHAWRGMAQLMHTAPAFKEKTCFAFFGISSPWTDERGMVLHSVWGRLPATALVMTAFAHADVFLYMDSDALLVYSNKTPTMMYNELSLDAYGENSTMDQLRPGLIVNKPLTGWLCSQCERYGLGHGCFNSGALLWHRDKAEPILKAWWEARKTNYTHNFIDSENGQGFHGWEGKTEAGRIGGKMGEQNRLMYIYATNPAVGKLIWPVPRQKSIAFDSTSCPNGVDEGHTPCLQNDFIQDARWNPSKPSCFISHFAGDAGKKADLVMKHADGMMGNRTT